MATEVQRASRKQEGRIVKSLTQIGDEARNTMASGAMWFDKSDGVSTMFQIEAKTRVKEGAKQISIKKEWLTKIATESLGSGRTPVLAFSFGGSRDYFVLEDRDFYALVEELIELRKGGGGNERED